jgi:N-acyl-D-aspartate/D-glutamate deacylase
VAWSLLIKNGTVIDGSGCARQKADVAIAGDTIAAVAPQLPENAAHSSARVRRAVETG